MYQSETDGAELTLCAVNRLGAKKTLGALETNGAEECAIVGSLETDGAKLTLGQSKTEGAEKALVALDALGTIDAAAAVCVCRWSCELSGIRIKKQQKAIVR